MKIIDLGSAKPGDPIYSSGLIVGGERLPRSRKNSPNKDNVVSRDVIDLKRVVKILGDEGMDNLRNQGPETADNDQEPS